VIESTPSGTSSSTGNKSSRLSRDGKWRSFNKVPHLLQYVSTGKYYGRVKIGGKIIRKSLQTSAWATAKLRLPDFIKQQQIGSEEKHHAPTFKQSLDLLTAKVDSDTALKPSSKRYRHHCIRKIELTWPELWERRIDEITHQDCMDWAATLSTEIASQYFNNVVCTLRLILGTGIKHHATVTGSKIENPAEAISKVRIPQKQHRLPEPGQFQRLIVELRKTSPRWGDAAADLVEFLAYSGVRLKTEARWIHWGDVDWNRLEIVVRGHPDNSTKNWEIRRIPIIADMDRLLKRLMNGSSPNPGEKVLQILQCPVSLGSACKKVGIARLRHHDLRHLFATRCIESGVDIPTVSKWLGHKDGGALAMKVYGHLRNEHSQAMARKVKF
jgi:integrase